jgi:hypothetical protein
MHMAGVENGSLKLCLLQNGIGCKWPGQPISEKLATNSYLKPIIDKNIGFFLSSNMLNTCSLAVQDTNLCSLALRPDLIVTATLLNNGLKIAVMFEIDPNSHMSRSSTKEIKRTQSIFGELADSADGRIHISFMIRINTNFNSSENICVVLCRWLTAIFIELTCNTKQGTIQIKDKFMRKCIYFIEYEESAVNKYKISLKDDNFHIGSFKSQVPYRENHPNAYYDCVVNTDFKDMRFDVVKNWDKLGWDKMFGDITNMKEFVMRDQTP